MMVIDISGNNKIETEVNPLNAKEGCNYVWYGYLEIHF